jgi:hypothetical protein
MGYVCPEEIRIVGIDDVKYSGLLPVPLTTQHQNCADIGAMAMVTMLQRVEKPDLPTRDILLQTAPSFADRVEHIAPPSETYSPKRADGLFTAVGNGTTNIDFHSRLQSR